MNIKKSIELRLMKKLMFFMCIEYDILSYSIFNGYVSKRQALFRSIDIYAKMRVQFINNSFYVSKIFVNK